MLGIGGNITAELQVKTTELNKIGERVPVWSTVQTLNGWLDLQSGDSRHSNFNAKLQESTHVFVCDYVPLDQRVTVENSMLVINGQVYDITVIDNPMGLNYQLEFYLRYVGGQNG